MVQDSPGIFLDATDSPVSRWVIDTPDPDEALARVRGHYHGLLPKIDADDLLGYTFDKWRFTVNAREEEVVLAIQDDWGAASLEHKSIVLRYLIQDPRSGSLVTEPPITVSAKARPCDPQVFRGDVPCGVRSGEPEAASTKWLGIRNWRFSPLFLIAVVLPFVTALIYYGGVASDVYISEARFIVRTPQRQNASGLGALLQGSVLAKTNEDANAVHEYVKSRDALVRLNEKLNLRIAFGATNADPFSRFPWLDQDESMEQLHRYFLRHVVVEANSSTTVTTLKVYAFTAQDAYAINQELIELAEELVNQLNQRARQDMIRYAAAEVALAEEKVKHASVALSEFRGRSNVFDPEKQSNIQLQLVAKLQDELISRKASLSQLKSISPQNPQIPSVVTAISDLDAAIESEKAKVVGQKASLSSRSVEYERLALDRAFAEKQLASAMTSLELARDEAQRKQIYLELVALPSLPDAALEPRRVRNIFACLLLGLVAWGVLAMLVAGIREHQD